MSRVYEPSIRETAFSCPYCGAYTTQHWHSIYVKYLGGGNLPVLPTRELVQELTAGKPEEDARIFLAWADKMNAKLIFTDRGPDIERVAELSNVFVTECYRCQKWAIWVNDGVIYPPRKFGSLPNQDLPASVLPVVEEARSILDLSPKGAAAMLRLAIQMLCGELGESGRDLNADIASLVRRGLNPVVQKSLDIVRVIGNESVHPGVIDLNDDKDTAIRLFDLINIIADQMITQPKHVDELYGKLPEEKRRQIEQRDTKGRPPKAPG